MRGSQPTGRLAVAVSSVPDDDLDPEFQEQADLARSLDARVVRAYAHTGKDFSTALVIELLDADAAAMVRIKEALYDHCRKRGTPPSVIVVNSTTPRLQPRVPGGRPPDAPSLRTPN
jgi:hypothetical protein